MCKCISPVHYEAGVHKGKWRPNFVYLNNCVQMRQFKSECRTRTFLHTHTHRAAQPGTDPSQPHERTDIVIRCL